MQSLFVRPAANVKKYNAGSRCTPLRSTDTAPPFPQDHCPAVKDLTRFHWVKNSASVSHIFQNEFQTLPSIFLSVPFLLRLKKVLRVSPLLRSPDSDTSGTILPSGNLPKDPAKVHSVLSPMQAYLSGSPQWLSEAVWRFPQKNIPLSMIGTFLRLCVSVHCVRFLHLPHLCFAAIHLIYKMQPAVFLSHCTAPLQTFQQFCPG